MVGILAQNKMMKTPKLLKKLLFLGVAAGLIGLVLCSVYISNETSLDSPQKVTPMAASSEFDEPIKIGVIGDSWVAGMKLDAAIEQAMGKSGCEVAVLSSGHPGAKSRQIYRNLFSEATNDYSSKGIFLDESLDYLVVVAGVNDTSCHVGKEFYAHHLLLIAEAALARGLTPVIVEIPEYGIEEALPTGFLSWGKTCAYVWWFDGGVLDVIEEYRAELQTRIKDKGLVDKILVVDFSEIIADYGISNELYKNPSHLNADGYSELGKLIGNRIVEWHKGVSRPGGDAAAVKSDR